MKHPSPPHTRTKKTLFLIITLCGMAACSPPTPTPEPTEELVQAPTDTPAPTDIPTEAPTNTPEPTATPDATATPAETATPTATLDPAEALEQFRLDLIAALKEPRDGATIAALMGDDFIFYIFGTDYLPRFTATAAAKELLDEVLFPGNEPTYDFSVSDAEVLAGENNRTVLDIFPAARDYIYSDSGWYPNGNEGAILVIGTREDGSYYWMAILTLWNPAP